MKLDVLTLDGKKNGSIDLSADIFGQEERGDLLHRAVMWQQGAQRQGSANSKTRSEINRTGAKWGNQKGGGRARHGSRRVGSMRGGAAVFGPKPRSFATDLPKKVRALAVKVALSSKAKAGNLVVLEAASTKSHKTKELATQLSKLELTNALFVVDSFDENFDKASRNLPHVKVIPTEGVNVLDILRREKLVVTKAAAQMLSTRLAARAAGETTTA